MPSGGGGGSTQTIQKADPWSGQQPYLTQQFQEAQRLYGTGLGANGVQLPAAAPSSAAPNSAPGSGQATYKGVNYAFTPGMSLENFMAQNHLADTRGASVALDRIQNGTGSSTFTPAPAATPPASGDTTGTTPQTGSLLAPGYYPGQTIASQSPQTQAAIDMLTNRALSGSPLTSAANQNVFDTLNGAYLDPRNNPGFSQALNDVAKAYSTGTAAATDAAFNRSGAYGGSAYNEAKGMQNKAFADSLNTLAGNLYQQGRNNQLQAAVLAPTLAGQDYTNIGQLAQAGSAVDQRNQSLINSDIDRYNYNANLPANALRNYIGLTGGNYGGTTTTTQPYSQNSLANTLGTGIGALGAYNALPSLGSLLGSSAVYSGFGEGAGLSLPATLASLFAL